jgi:predicted TIM-barrel fold metal-dependent hydrolase
VLRIIDSHAHSVAASSMQYPHISPQGGPPVRQLTVEIFEAMMTANGVSKALMVQRSQAYGLDNSMICDRTAGYLNLFPVCAVSAADPNCEVVARGWAARGAIGFRMMGAMHDRNVEWLEGAGAEGLWFAAAELDLPICVHLFQHNRIAGLAAVTRLAAANPAVRIVIDHLSNGVGSNSGIDAPLLTLMELPQVVLKVTTIPLHRLREEGRMQSVIDDYVAAFGADHLMWGSDITQSSGEYADLVALGREAVAHLDPTEQAHILADTCERVYGLDRAMPEVAVAAP